MIYFTSDTHFGHKNIIKYCNRPFDGVGRMDAVIIENIYNTVGPDDILYHLGDVALYDKAAQRFLDSLCCREFHVILGNHDGRKLQKMLSEHPKVTSVSEEGKLTCINNGKTVDIELTHYPPAFRLHSLSEGSKVKGVIKLHGHIHSQDARMFNNTLDVGVDGHEFMPWSLEEILIGYEDNLLCST